MRRCLQRWGRAIAVVVMGTALVAALAAVWVASPAEGTESPAAGATLRIGWTADPDNLSPFIGVETAAFEVLNLTYDRLFGFGVSTASPSRSSPPSCPPKRTAASPRTASRGPSRSGPA